MPRTTLHLEDEALDLAKAYAVRHHITLGQAVSALVKHGAARAGITTDRNGLRVLRLDDESPTVRAAAIQRLLRNLA